MARTDAEELEPVGVTVPRRLSEHPRTSARQEPMSWTRKDRPWSQS